MPGRRSPAGQGAERLEPNPAAPALPRGSRWPGVAERTDRRMIALGSARPHRDYQQPLGRIRARAVEQAQSPITVFTELFGVIERG